VLNRNAVLVGGLLVLWGLSGTVSNLVAGRLSDSIGNRKVIVAALVMLALVMASLQVAGANIWTTAVMVSLWGAVAWGSLAPQQHRLVAAAPQSAPVVLGLNTSGTYLGMTISGVIGAVSIPVVGGHYLGYIAAALVVVATGVAELASGRINAAKATRAVNVLASA
jgi:predicted MFS family arabinose efflux permease